MLANHHILIAIEVEAGQTHPDTNTGKYWSLNVEYKLYKKTVLFHVYTPDFHSYPWRKKLAEFYVNKMSSEVPIEYVPMDYRNRTAADYNATLAETKAKIEERVKQEFGLANPG